ncbi:MAG: ATP-binding protein, partial [Sulfurifustaceae bacterium]
AYLSGTEDLNTLRQTGIRAVQTTPLYSRGGKLVGMISTHWRIPHEPSERDLCLLDILARQAADLIERKRAEEALRESDRRKDEFLATLSHELRNPLAPIRQAAKLLKAPDISERDAQWARDVIDRQVRAMGWLLDDLLDLSRIARGKLELRKESVELADIVESAVETARPLIDAKRHALRIELPATAVRFEADPLRLAQIVSNLLTNAAKYTEPQGQIRLWAREEQDELIIGVTDTGIGISADMLPKVFEMFSQAAPALDRTEGGLGIGLALVRGFAALHRGSVAARSDGLGRGSEFTLRLPLGTPSVQSAAAVPTAAHSHRAPGRRVLVVDDNRDTAETLATLLHMQGYEVRTAFDGREALDVAEAFHPDITLLDIGMPQMNGYEAAQHIRSRLWGQRTTLIAVTGWGQEDDMRRAIASGFDYHLRKPIDFDLLQPLLTVPPAGR